MFFVLETARIDIRERLRRNSDSAVFFRPKEETPVLKIMNERIAWLERKIQQLHPEILEDCSPEEKATKFSRQQESWKGNNFNLRNTAVNVAVNLDEVFYYDTRMKGKGKTK